MYEENVGCLVLLSGISVSGIVLAALFTAQLCAMRSPKRGLMRRVLHLLGLLGSIGGVVSRGGMALECLDILPISLASRAVQLLASDISTTLFLLMFLVVVYTFLLALFFTVPRTASIPLLTIAILDVCACLLNDVAQIALNRRWPGGLFLWWLVASFWLALLFTSVAAFLLAREMLREPVGWTPGRKALRDFLLLLLVSALMVALLSYFWAHEGAAEFADKDTTTIFPVDSFVAHYVFASGHTLGLIGLLWWSWVSLAPIPAVRDNNNSSRSGAWSSMGTWTHLKGEAEIDTGEDGSSVPDSLARQSPLDSARSSNRSGHTPLAYKAPRLGADHADFDDRNSPE